MNQLPLPGAERSKETRQQDIQRIVRERLKGFYWRQRGREQKRKAKRPSPRPNRSQRPEAIPYNIAFREVIAFVTKELNDSGEQWSEQSRQDLASTCLISIAKAGLLGVWER